jgi:hypothetical protein
MLGIVIDIGRRRVVEIPRCRGFWLDLRVGVLTNMENSGTQGTRGFIEVRASMRIKPLHPVCVICIMIHWVETRLPLLL